MPKAIGGDQDESVIRSPKCGPELIGGDIQEIPLEDIVPPAHDVRAWIPEEHVESLAASLAAIGLIHEPVVYASDGRYEIISGHCRFLAAKRLGWETLRCKIVATDEISGDILKMHENMYRSDLTAMEKAEFVAGLKRRYDLKDDDIAIRLGKSRAWVTRLLACLKYPKDIQAAMTDGVIGFEVAWELSKITDEKYRSRLIEYATRDGATRKLATLWREDWERTQRAMAEIHAQEAQAQADARSPELLDRARVQQISQREEFRKAHVIPSCPCDLCGQSVREDAMVSFRLCQECSPAIAKARDQFLAQAVET